MTWRAGITDLDAKTDVRFNELQDWLAGLDRIFEGRPVPASSDASFRRYFRVQGQGDDSYIVMDAPPDREDSQPFVQVAEFLRQMNLNCANVLQADFDQGFLLLTDLGTVQYLTELNARPETADGLYSDALRALLRMQTGGAKFQSELPPYDDAMLASEMEIFVEWLCGEHLGIRFARGEQNAWESFRNMIVDSAMKQPPVFVHRDYHSRNLMLTRKNNPGILDFQDAVEGPLTYDLVSLLKDCYIRWPREQVDAWATDYYRRLPSNMQFARDDKDFLASFELMGVQRHLKAAGIFARLLIRDGKPGYLKDVPRTLRYVAELGDRYSGFEFMSELISSRILPALGSEAT